MQNTDNKKLILKSLAKHTKELRGEQSQFMLCSENDISCSIISTIERAKKDPQLTTIFKIAEAFDMKAWHPRGFVSIGSSLSDPPTPH